MYEADKYSIITYHFLNQQTEVLEMKMSSQGNTISDIKQGVELIREDIIKGNNQVKNQMSTKIRIDCSLCSIHLLYFYGVWSR